VIPYFPLSDEMLGSIVKLQLGRVQKRVRQNQGIDFAYDDAAVRLITSRCTEVESGGRMIDAILTNTVLPTLSQEILRRMLDGRTLSAIRLSADAGEFQYHYAD